MSDTMFEINAPGIDTEKIVQEIQDEVRKKMEDGRYSDAVVARAERTNLTNLRNDDEFMDFYIECLRDSVFVDINDFEIIERRSSLGGLLVSLKKVIWKLLKFYTYRLWSQQNQVNGLLLSAVENMEKRYKDKIAALEKRISELEKEAK
ncbi:hypothetical protein BVX97_05000 [bacterium E08(2017)]|nr:hypothetical protein BVX97_05000 [bacterium E08(2017)]